MTEFFRGIAGVHRHRQRRDDLCRQNRLQGALKRSMPVLQFVEHVERVIVKTYARHPALAQRLRVIYGVR